MSSPEIIEKRSVTLAEVKDMLHEIHERDEELTFRGGKTEDYINEVAQITGETAKKAIQTIMDLEVPRLKEAHIVKIIDVLPESSEHLKIIINGFNLTIKKEDLQKIVDALDEFRPIKK